MVEGKTDTGKYWKKIIILENTGKKLKYWKILGNKY